MQPHSRRQVTTISADTQTTTASPWSSTYDEVAARLGVDVDAGLSDEEAARRLEEHGPNEVEREEGRSRWDIVVSQFVSPIVGLLVAAGVAAAAFGEIVEAIAIVIAVVINAIIGYVTEARAQESVESLEEIGRTQATVRRGGEPDRVDGRELVPGDVVVLEEGDVIPADVRLIDAANLSVDEAPLTGESEPVDKHVDPVEEDTPLAERASMAFKGTSVQVGSGAGLVVGTGADTAIGEVSTLVSEAGGDKETPLEEQLDGLGKALIGAVVVVAIVVSGIGILVGQPVRQMIETAIALAIAAVPEGLPVVATLALARGVVRMSKRNALVKRLASVETLGSASVIFSDKTGTLTEGRMQARRLLLAAGDGEARAVEIADLDGDADDELALAALRVGGLCGNATLGEEPADDLGDPMEAALQRGALRAGLGDRDDLLEAWPERREVAFDRGTRMMATYHEDPDGGELLVAVKGAPEAVLDAATTEAGGAGLDDEARERWSERNTELAADGLRVLALARRRVSGIDVEPYEDLELLGLVALLDPPRGPTSKAVEDCHHAGVRVIMVTGDQPATATAIAREVGIGSDGVEVVRGAEIPAKEEWDDERRQQLVDTAVFARLEPAQKLDLVELHQQRGAVVGMTGDGVNDAPALQQADIGISMGARGTQVARDASDIVLQDDAFETIVAAIREGRTIFGNIRRFVVYLLSGNLGEIAAVTLAAVVGAPLPLLPLQILFINLVSDVFPATALGLVPGSDAVLDDPPRDPDSAILDRDRWIATIAWSVLIAGTTLGVFALGLGPLGLETDAAVTVSFLAFVLARLVHVFNMRGPSEPILTNRIARSRAVWAALATSTTLLLLGVYIGPLARILGIVTPTATMWGLALAGGAVVLVVGQLAISALQFGRDV